MTSPVWIPASRLPDCLREDAISPPISGLFHIGRSMDELGPRVAVVGTRRPTAYGLEVAREVAAGLARAGICVVSGMARGIDAAAHEGALSVGGATIAVLAGGADRPYPASSRGIYERIASGAGAVVSEAPLGSDHRAELFLERNRIIAALSLGLVLVQADPRRSGALTTVRVAGALGREVFAVPGDVRSLLSGGPHGLLRDGARICTGASDVLDVLMPEIAARLERAHEVPPGLDGEDERMIRAVNDGPATLDELRARTAFDGGQAMRALTRLELRGLVTRDGARYRRTL